MREILPLSPLLCICNSPGFFQSLHSPAHRTASPPSPLVGGGVNYLMSGTGRRNQAWIALPLLLSLGNQPLAENIYPAGGSKRWGGEQRGLTQACVSNSRKLTCPFFPTLLYSVRKIIIDTSHIHTYRLTLLSHFSVGSEFRKRGAIYWAPIRILETIQFPIFPHIHTYNSIFRCSRSHELVGHWPDPPCVMFCLAHRVSFENNCTNI